MNTISAIETRYKGYRFRSRLEARWAMFYDLVGVSWTYETDPLSVNGEAYLPDFNIRFGGGNWDTVHEVKSLHEADRIRPITVYLAGKMKSPTDWRGSHPNTMYGLGAFETARTNLDGAAFIYGGPFILADDHRGSHAPWVRHMAESWCGPSAGSEPGHSIVAQCFKSIQISDLVCAHINSHDAYGTLVEIGYALALKKPVSVTISEAVADSMRRAPWEESDHADDPPGAHDLWFAQEAANHSAIVADDAEARAFHAGIIRGRTCREYRLISAIGHATNSAVMTFGDPLDVANRGIAHQWSVNVIPMCQNHRNAAEHVRAHRFDRH